MFLLPQHHIIRKEQAEVLALCTGTIYWSLIIVLLLSTPGAVPGKTFESNQTSLKGVDKFISHLDQLKRFRFKTDSVLVESTLDSLSNAVAQDQLRLAQVHYYQGIFYNVHRNRVRSRDFQKQALQLAQHLKNDELIARVLIEFGKLESAEGNNAGAIEYYLSAIDYATRTGDHRDAAVSYSLLGNIYRIMGEYDDAINYITKAESHYAEEGYSEGQAWVQYSLANIYKDLDLLDEALDYFNKSLAVYADQVSQPGDSLGVAICLDQIGEIYFGQEKFEVARKFVMRSYIIHTEMNNIHGIVITLKNLGKIEYELKNYARSLQYLTRAINSKIDSKDVLVSSQIYEYMGRSLFEMGQPQAGIDTVKVGLNLATDAQQRKMENRLYGVLAEMYRKEGDLVSAYEYLSQQVASTKALADRLAELKISGMKNFHEREERRIQINTLNFENQLIKMKLDEQRRSQLYLALVLIMILVVSFVLIFLYLSKRKALQLVDAQRKELEDLVATKNKFFSIISHDLRSPVGSTMQLLATAIDVFPSLSREKVLELLTTMSEASSNTFRLLENLLIWSRIQTGTMQVYIDRLDLPEHIEPVLSMHKDQAIGKGLSLRNEIKEQIFVNADSDMFSGIMRNLISNAIKYTPRGGEIVISATQSESEVVVKIADTGIGIPPDQYENIFTLGNTFKRKGTSGESSSGLGLILVKEFVDKLGGEINVESEINKGTCFSVSLKRAEI